MGSVLEVLGFGVLKFPNFEVFVELGKFGFWL